MNFQSWFFTTLVDRIGMALVHFLWQGAAIAVVLAAALRILHHRSPQSRYFAAWMGLAAMTVCLPITAFYFPSASRAEIARHAASRDMDIARKPPVDRSDITARAEPTGSGFEANIRPENDTESAEFSDRAVVSPRDAAMNSRLVPSRQASPAKAEWSIAFFARLLQPVLPWIVGVWLFGAMTLAVWHLGGFRHLVRLRRQGTAPAPAEIEQVMLRLSSRLGIRRAVSVLVSHLAQVPIVLGWLRPVILLPAGILGEMPPEQFEMILAHELAHVRRLDFLWNLLQIAVETVLFYHPAVWWVSRRIREERENCCDRQAVAAMGSPLVYAGALMRLAEIRCQLDQAAAPAGSMAADGGSLESRIRRVLGLPVGSACTSNAWLGGILAVLILAAVFFVNITWAESKPFGGAQSQPSGGAQPRPSGDKESSSATTTAPAAPLSMTAEAFGKLSDAQQRDVLVKAFQQRLDLAKNLFVENDQFDRGFENRGGEPGAPLKKSPGFRALYRVWRLGDSFKRDTEYRTNPQSGVFTSCESYAVNASEGLARVAQTYREEGQFRPNGQVMYPNPATESMNRYHFWLDRQYPAADAPKEEEHLFRELVDKKDKFEIKGPIEGDKIQLTLPWRMFQAGKESGTRVLILDPQKGFLPIRVTSHGEQPAIGAQKALREEGKIEVVESRLVGDVWMPGKFTEQNFFSLFPDQINICEVRVLHFEAGKVKPADLLVPFAKGMNVEDCVEGVTYTADAQGHATAVKDAPDWKHDPPKGWPPGRVDQAYSLASTIPAAERQRLVAEREAKSKPIDEGLKVLRADPPALQAQRIEAALKILRVYRVGEREGDWATAIRELITVGRPAVPRLIEELDRTENDKTLRALAFVLRGIGDRRAVPALIRVIPRLIQPSSSDFGLTIKNDPELLKFMWMRDVDHLKNKKDNQERNGLILFTYGRPIREVMPALEILTGQTLGWRQLNFADAKADGTIQLRRQRGLFLDHARKWADWWSNHWKGFVTDEADAQLQETQKSLDQFAESIAKMPQPALPTDIPCGPHVRIGGGVTWHEFEPYLSLGSGRQPTKPGELLKNSPKDHPSPELLAWAQREGIDLLRIELKRQGDSKTYYGYQPVGMKVWKIDNKRLKNLEEELQKSKRLDLPALWEGPISSVDRQTGDIDEEEPATFLFITRDGTCGTIQIRSGLVPDLVPGSPWMGSSLLEYQYIFQGEPAKPALKNDKPVAAPPPATSSKEKEKAASDSTLHEGKPAGDRNPPPTVTAKKAAPLPVSGRVLYHDGTPAAGASVFLVGNAGTTIGAGKAWQGIRSDNTEDKTVPKATTDAAGRFTLHSDGAAKRIVVSAPRLDFWVVPTPENAAAKDADFTIKLPAPGRLVVKYDIPGGDAKAKLFLQVNTWDSPLSSGIQCTPAPLVANKGQIVLDNLPPGQCYLDREKNIAWGTHFCDRRLLTIESGKTLESNFIRDRGTAVVGRVVGLNKEMRAAVSGAPDSAGVLVSVRSSEATGDFIGDLKFPLFDVLKCGLDGRFKTEQLLPGKYAIIVEAWLPEKPEEMRSSGIRPSTFVGRAVVTVPESGQSLQATVELKPRENAPPAKSSKDGKESSSGTPKRS